MEASVKSNRAMSATKSDGAASRKRAWYLWHTKAFPLLAALLTSAAVRMADGGGLASKACLALTVYFFVYRKLPYKKFKGEEINWTNGKLSFLIFAFLMGVRTLKKT